RLRKKERLVRERSRQILEAAAKVFARKGFHQATMKEIAEEADIAPGTIYLYFKNKKDLLVNIPRLVTEPLLEEMQELGEGVFSEDALKQLVRRHLNRALEHVEIFKVLFSSLSLMDEKTKEEYLRRTPLYLAGEVEKRLRQGIEMGLFRPLDPTIAARAFLGMIFIFFLSQEIMPGKLIAPLDYDQVVDEVVSIFFHGILKRQSREG
ncbi:MAG: hypothetical protein DRI61_13265, partial [Chloroflexi bacterium]